MKLIPFILVMVFLVGSTFTSCKKNPTGPPIDTSHKCDTCSDTTHHPCDTCNLNKDSLAHAFVWTQHTVPGEVAITGCKVFGTNDIYLLGRAMWHFDGVNFTQVTLLNSSTNKPYDFADDALFALSKTDFWMVSGSVALHCTDGKYFDDIRPGNVNACWGSSSNDIFIVGNSGHIAHYDGIKFTDMTSNTTKDLQSVWGTSHNDVWACGANTSTGETVILHYDGNSWTIDNLSNDATAKSSGFFVVWACDSNNTGHHFVATSGSNVYRKTDNTIWRNDGALIPNALGGNTFVGLYLLGGNTPNDILAAGSWGWVGHWNGKTWKRYDTLYDYNNINYDSRALSINGNTACVVGTKNGASWVAIGHRKQ